MKYDSPAFCFPPSAFCFLEQAYQAWVPYSIRLFVWRVKDACLNPYLLALAAFLISSIFILEKVIPARRDQKIFSVGLFQDFVWFIFDLIFRISIVISFWGALKVFYNRYLGFLTLHAVEAWPMAVRAIVSYVIGDFLAWFHHFARHKVKPFWFFHAIHHSQPEINVFTEARRHVMEHIVAFSLVFIPSLILQVNFSTIVWLPLFHEWYKHIYHANLKTNYGFLKYFMVTPQFHRIHHSMEPQHQDKNFGVIFTFWDRIFGTLYKNYDEYPETGIEDTEFPVENRGSVFVLSTWLKQFLYPFQLMFREKQRVLEDLCQKPL